MSHPHEWEDVMTVSPMGGDGKYRWSHSHAQCKRCGSYATRGPNGFVGEQRPCDEVIAKAVLES